MNPAPMVRGVDAVALRLRDRTGFGSTELIESFYLAPPEISTPKPHSDAVKAVAGIDAMNLKRAVAARRGPFPARVLAPAAAKSRLCRGR
jgi:hypothetical protein